jgi:radical SAM superfamily enzyme YgiQ (UPF0313 family)
MRIQLLHPPSLLSPGNLQTSRPTPPLGLAYVAAALREAGHDCQVIDGIAEAPNQFTPVGNVVQLGLTHEQVLDRIDPEADALAIGCMFSFNWPFLRELIRTIKERYPAKIIVCGGEHFSALAQASMATSPIDYIVMGEGEEIAVDLFARLDSGLPFDPTEVKGICWRRGDEIVENPRADRTKLVDDIPWPAWDLFDLDGYNENDLVGGLDFGKVVPILANRGCPYQCTYCSSPNMWTTRWYTRDPVKVCDEIEHYVREHGANNFPFQDLTMIIKRDWIIQFCNEIIQRDLDIRWQLPSGTRCEVIDDEVAALLYKSGCRWLCYAPESGSEKTRELIKKKMKTSSLINAIEASVRNNLHLSTFFIIGFPHDTEESLRETASMVRQLARKGADDIAVHFYFPIPSTELYRYLESKGRVQASDEHLLAPLFDFNVRLADHLNFCEHLSAKTLTRWKYRILANFYLTQYITHPSRVIRTIYNAARGRQTTAMEKFVGERLRKVRFLGRLRSSARQLGDAASADRKAA